MSSTDPPAIGNVADAERLAYIVQCFIPILGGDPRVRAAYGDWQRAHRLGRLLRRIKRRRDQCEADTPEDVAAYRAAVFRNEPHDLGALTTFARDELGLAYDWLPRLLLGQFRLWNYMEARGESLAVAARAPADLSLPKGRGMRRDGSNLAQYIEWYYRHEIKRPPDSIHQIAAEYARRLVNRTDARSEIQHGIRRAKQLLATTIVPPSE